MVKGKETSYLLFAAIITKYFLMDIKNIKIFTYVYFNCLEYVYI